MLILNKGNETRYIGAPLVPGLNRLSPAQAEAFKKAVKLPYNQNLVEKQEIEIVKDKPLPITDLSAEDAIKLVKDMSDVDMLAQLKEEESRVTVLRAIDTQIGELTSPAAEEEPVIEEQE